MFYAQTNICGWTGYLLLHGETVADAAAARQVPKTEIKSGEFLTRPEPKKKEEMEMPEKGSEHASA